MSRTFKTTVVTLAISAMCGCKFFSSAPASVQLNVNAAPFKNLSEYGFFTGKLKNLQPSERVIPYSLLNTMFNDHAQKKSFVYMPEGKTISSDEAGNFNFPEGSCLINCVYFPVDERDENKGITLIETQLLIKTEKEWKALNYVWNNNQKDAVLDLTGDIKKVSWIDKNGSERSVDFVIAGKNQCKSCHNANGQLVPIGVSAIGLNKTISVDGKKIHQLDYWKQLGLLNAGFEKKETTYINWQDKTQPLEKRVRAYLHINCAYCHNTEGPGKMSGLLLNYDNYNMETYGLCKSPPSAGKGSCNLKYDIVPGKPGESILVCRMAATDLETKMPELGRTTADNEGIRLIIEWILQLEGNCLVTETAHK